MGVGGYSIELTGCIWKVNEDMGNIVHKFPYQGEMSAFLSQIDFSRSPALA